MKVERFLQHHGISQNPFAQEDASSDHVFRQHCLDGTRHPAWDKIYGNPEHPATAVVFGEKGSGKTALRIQIVGELERYNQAHSDQRAFIIEYDDFNPFLDCFRERLHGRKRRTERALVQWRLWDHMDAILALSVTRLADRVDPARQTAPPAGQPPHPTDEISAEQLGRLSRLQKRDLLLIAALYDHTLAMPARQRWSQLRRKLRFPVWRAFWDRLLGAAMTIATVALVWNYQDFSGLFQWWVAALIVGGWLPWLSRQAKLLWLAWNVSRQIRVFDHMPNTLRSILARFPQRDIAGQPIPSKDRSDDRYELLSKLQSILQTLGFSTLVVLVDRVDEPHLVNGSPERMRDLLWPMFDNKFLKSPGMAFKLLLPKDVVYYLDRESKEFYDRARLDKQNLIPSLEWTGESLFDVANDRIHACAAANGSASSQPAAVSITEMFDPSITENELISIFSRLRVPRHLFKFFHRLLVEHCGRFTEEHPSWRIGRDTLQATLALYLRDLDALDRGAGTG